MPRLTVWMVRTALLQLGIGFTFGMLMLYNKGVPFDPLIWRLLPIHIELVLLGWTVQLAMGVAFWVLPRFSIAPRYGHERLGWLAFVLLNTGVIVFAVGVWSSKTALSFTGRIFELSAVVSFAMMIWPRVKAMALPSK
ncbi:MAG: cbb3-type cytochrome c oxidase subunit I [Chloroflexota bacterium]